MTPFFRCFPYPLSTHQLRESQYPEFIWRELCGQMTYLVAEKGGNKGHLSQIAEAVCCDSRQCAGALRAMGVEEP